MSSMSYKFSVIRFVPDPARGEFVNLGAIVGDEEAQDWDMRVISNYRRAKAIDPRGVLPDALSFVASLDEWVSSDEQLQLQGPQAASVDRLSLLASESRNIVQFTPPAPVVAASSAEALDLLFDNIVLDPTARKFRFEKKHRAQRSTREAYQAHEVPREAIKERAQIVSGAFDETFDFAVHNGRAVQLVQCWSFQLPDQDDLADQVKAWSWVVHELRRQGGELRTETGSIEVPDQLEIAAVCILPLEGQDAPAYQEGLAAFSENDVRHLTPDEADELGANARRLMVARA